MSQCTPSTDILLYCRAGFERECALEVADRSADCGVAGESTATLGSGFVVFAAADPRLADLLRQRLRFDELVFARQLIFSARLVEGLPATDRLGPLIAAAQVGKLRFAQAFVEHADTEEGKRLSSFCRKFSAVFDAAAAKEGLVVAQARTRLHLFFPDAGCCYVGYSDARNASPWPLGIPRIKFPAGAPSRSALKLAEAISTLLTPAEQTARMCAGMRAVDLGAAPGGWSWCLAQRGIHVTAVDNGPLAKEVLATGFVEHLRSDGFHFRPKRAVDWMVCDIVEKPSRVAALVAQWVSRRWCRHCIFNLKLPMKKRYEELQKCTALICSSLDGEGIAHRLRFKQLYHDRDEVTGYLCAVQGPRRKR
jgi:23S rRNA (cytidine2498-2'-O)-methyltransferase